MVKKVLIVGLAIVAGFIAVILGRALSFESRQLQVEPVEIRDVDIDAAAARLAASVNFRTISHQEPADFEASEFAGLHRFLEKSYPRVHATLKKELVGKWSLLYTWEGTETGLDPVVLMGHIDVVPVAPGTEELWEQDAFEGTVNDGWIFGRGTLDDKCNVMAALESAEILLGEGFQPKRTVYFAFGHDEEVGGEEGAVKIADALKARGVRAQFVMDEGGAIVSGVLPGMDAPVATVGVAEKGFITVELTITAEGGHSSQPPRETAIGTLSRAVSRLEQNQMPGGIGGLASGMLEYLGPEMDFGMKLVVANLWLFNPLVESQFGASPVMNAFMRTTTAPTIFQAGVKENVLPANARAVINFRILPGDTRESVVEHVRSVIADERIEVNPLMEWGNDPSPVSPASGPEFNVIAKSIREVVPEAVVAPYLVLAATDARHFTVVSDHVYRFSPVMLENSDLARIHGTNERVGVESYATMIRFYCRLLENAVG